MSGVLRDPEVVAVLKFCWDGPDRLTTTDNLFAAAYRRGTHAGERLTAAKLVVKESNRGYDPNHGMAPIERPVFEHVAKVTMDRLR